MDLDIECFQPVDRWLADYDVVLQVRSGFKASYNVFCSVRGSAVGGSACTVTDVKQAHCARLLLVWQAAGRACESTQLWSFSCAQLQALLCVHPRTCAYCLALVPPPLVYPLQDPGPTNGVVASVPGHPLWLKVLALMKERWQENPGREVVELTGDFSDFGWIGSPLSCCFGLLHVAGALGMLAAHRLHCCCLRSSHTASCGALPVLCAVARWLSSLSCMALKTAAACSPRDLQAPASFPPLFSPSSVMTVQFTPCCKYLATAGPGLMSSTFKFNLGPDGPKERPEQPDPWSGEHVIEGSRVMVYPLVSSGRG